MTEILDCGHESDPSGFAAGYARSDEGTLCYKCAADKIKADALMNNHLVAYVSLDDERITTWDGQTLGEILFSRVSKAARKTYYSAELWDGRLWFGTGPAESGTYVSLRPYKNQ